MGDSYDHLFKILLVGDSGVGKSCLLMRFTADRFDDVTTSTIGALFLDGDVCARSLTPRSRDARATRVPSRERRRADAVVARASRSRSRSRSPRSRPAVVPAPLQTTLQKKTGVDFRVKYVTLAGRRVKLTVWDTAGQERFRTLTSSYYRGAQGIVFAYDVTRRDTFENVERIWMKEVELYSNVEDAVKMVVANKVDLVGGARGQRGTGAGRRGE